MTKKNLKKKSEKKYKVRLARDKNQTRNYLDQLFVNNFKGIEDNNKPIKFAKKITLLFGKNSAGKSSILQAIKLIQQSLENENDLVLNPSKSYQGGIFFPSYKDLVSKGDLNKSISLGITSNEVSTFTEPLMPKNKDLIKTDPNKKSIIKKFSFRKKQISCDEIDFYSTTDDINKFVSLKNEIFNFKELSSEKKYFKSKISFIANKFAFREIFEETYKNKKKILTYINRSIQWRDDFEKLMKKRMKKNINKKELDRTVRSLNNLFSEYERPNKFSPANFQFPPNKKKISGILDLHKKFLEGLSNNYEDFLNYISDDIMSCKKFLYRNNVLYSADQITDTIPKELDSKDQIELNKAAGSFSSLIEFLCFVVAEINNEKIPTKEKFQNLPSKDGFQGKTLSPVQMVSYCNEIISRTLKSMLIFQGQRALPDVYQSSSSEDDFIGYNYEYLPKVIEKNKNVINKWLKHFGYDFEIVTKTIDQTGTSFIQHKKSKFKINYKYGGLGAENVLPVISQSVAANNKIIIFEEPERRAHPGLQVKLADLFVECSKQNQFIIETHSENLLLGILKNIRDKKISHKDVQVSYVYIDKDQTKVDELELNENGQFESNWRHGFFTERVDLL